ncbi:MAG: hypothetical protein AUF67_11840 [Acidobacteria bacterium 13_1_20CM_58_21]|nr:MAG: hypothetical protein AUF67_11840 [Acidobacteria bacterium 13_1_20CM_58_21]
MDKPMLRRRFLVAAGAATKRPIDCGSSLRAGTKDTCPRNMQGEEDPMTGVPKLLERIKVLCPKYFERLIWFDG